MNILNSLMSRIESLEKMLTPPIKTKERSNNPWRTSPKITPQQIRWFEWDASWVGWTQVKTLTFEKLASGGTWNVEYTWFGFQPTSYTIDAWRLNTSGQLITFSKSFVDLSWVESWYRTYVTTDYYLNNLFDAVYVWSSATWRTRADHDAFLPDWIRLDYSLSDLDIKMIITAYK